MPRQLKYKDNIAEYNGKFYFRASYRGKICHKRAYGAKNRSEAKKRLLEELKIMESKALGLYKPNKPVPLSMLCDLYANHNKIYNRSKTREEKRKALNEYFGLNTDARQIKRGDIEKWRIWLKEVKKLSNTTINKYTSYISLCYKLAVEDELIEDTPIKHIKRLEEPEEKVRYLSKEEMHKVLEALKSFPRFKNYVLLAIQTGFRVSNINYMRWEWVDIENRLITINPQDNKGGLNIIHEISDEILKIFQEIGIKKTGYVFPLGLNGKKPYANPQRDIINKVFKKAGIDASGFHIFRHTVGTTLSKNKVPFRDIQAFLHHSNPRTPFKYIHLVDYNQSRLDHIIQDFINV